MTQKDIRDIAAYYGAPCTYAKQKGNVNSMIIHCLEIRVELSIKSRRGTPIHIHLRPIASLTDEEKWQCAQLAGHEHRDTHYFMISADNDLLFYDLTSPNISPVYNPGAIVAYLQSIGVYVPNTIDKKYVNLVE